MSVQTFEREQFGQPLTPIERVIGGVVGLAAAAGHVALGTAAVVLFYVLLFGL